MRVASVQWLLWLEGDRSVALCGCNPPAGFGGGQELEEDGESAGGYRTRGPAKGPGGILLASYADVQIPHVVYNKTAKGAKRDGKCNATFLAARPPAAPRARGAREQATLERC
jgi:hypothetical protein